MMDFIQDRTPSAPRADAIANLSNYRVSSMSDRPPTVAAKPCRVAIAGTHEILLGMLRAILNKEFDVICTATDAGDLLDAVRRLRPEIALIDATMPGAGRADSHRSLRDAAPGLILIYMTPRTGSAWTPENVGADRAIHVVQVETAAELLRAVHVVAAGNSRNTSMAADSTTEIRPALVAAGKLTRREMEVVTLLVTGLPMKAVARQLQITARTVAYHKYRAMGTLGLRDNAELIEFAVRHGLLGENPATVRRAETPDDYRTR